jgi:hypothetical protein
MTFDFSKNKLLRRFKDERMAVSVIVTRFGGNWENCDSCPNGIHVSTNAWVHFVILALKTKISLGVISIIF